MGDSLIGVNQSLKRNRPELIILKLYSAFVIFLVLEVIFFVAGD